MGPPVLFAALTAVAVCAFIGLAVARASLVDAVYGRFAGCSGCLAGPALANDAYLLAGLVGLLALSRVAASAMLRAPLVLAAVAIVLVYGIDVGVFRMLGHRLLAVDVVNYGGDGGLLARVALPHLTRCDGALLSAAWLVTLAAWAGVIGAGRPSVRSLVGFGIGAAAVAAGAAVHQRPEYVHRHAFSNVLQVNLETDPSRAYTQRIVRDLAASPALRRACETGEARRPSVIVVVVESLSAYHSALFSGLHDATPHLDGLARRGTWLPGFRANAYSTEGALIALLTGRVPLPTAGRAGTTLAFTEVEGDFHRWIAGEGYATAFFTTGSLAYGARGRWLEAIGIATAEGAEHPAYDGMPRGAFGAAADAALFDRFLDWQSGARAPYMATLLTVETHPPYLAAGGRSDELPRIRRVDRELARFIAVLEARGFLEQGILVVMGDHRAMTPLHESERQALGVDAAMRVPAFMLGATGLPPGPLQGRMQQVDLIPSLRHVIGRDSCRSEAQGRFLGAGARAARYTVHPDPMRRNEVMVHGVSWEGRILLDGDDTRWLRAPEDGDAALRLLAQVNRERVGRMPELRAPGAAGSR